VTPKKTTSAIDKTRVYITVDTETSLGGAWRNPAYTPLPLERSVFGKIGSKYYGIPLIMDILEEFGFRGTFFTEVFCSYLVGADDVAKACRLISDRGHDCQLHLHPVFRLYRDYQQGGPRREMDLMFQFPLQEQRELIGEGVDLFRKLAGKPPRAYRAGGYGAAETTLAALQEHGVAIDSSYNLAYLGQSCGFDARDLNAPVKIHSVYEFPVTVFRVQGASGYKPLEISAVSANEILSAISALRKAGCRDVVLILHSFSLMKNLKLRFDESTPDHIVIRRFRKLCAALSERSDTLDVRTLGDLDLNTIPIPQPHVMPSLGWIQPAVRKLVQGVNRFSWT
jgi:hypothetical protein